MLTGAGVSLASGIPSFRSDGGVWTRWDPEEYGTLDAFRDDPAKVWPFLRELKATLEAARPNPAHRALAMLERRGFVHSVVTQNIDGLHQAAGSERVVELHGSPALCTCLACGALYTARQLEARFPDPEVPSCPRCRGPIKPNVVLFGEALPERELLRARRLADRCDVLLVVGTSAEVYPAAELPRRAARHRAPVWEVNPEPALREARSIVAPAEEALPRLVGTLLGPWAGLRLRARGRLDRGT